MQAMELRDKTLKKLGLIIRQSREAAALSQEALADKADLDITYISGIERGVRNPSILSLIALAKGLKTTVSKLVEGL